MSQPVEAGAEGGDASPPASRRASLAATEAAKLQGKESAYRATDDAATPDFKLASNQESTPENLKLYQATKKGDLKTVKKMLESGANPNYYKHPEDGSSATHKAAELGHTEILKELIAKGGEINDRLLTHHSTPLHLAAFSCNEDTVAFILDNGGEVNTGNAFGNSPLHSALMGGNINIVHLLLKRGADVTWANNKKSDAVHFVCYSHLTEEEQCTLLKELVEQHSANPSTVDEDGLTVVHIAAKFNKLVLLQTSLDLGVDPTLKDAKGHTAAFHAKVNDNSEAYKLLGGLETPREEAATDVSPTAAAEEGG